MRDEGNEGSVRKAAGAKPAGRRKAAAGAGGSAAAKAKPGRGSGAGDTAAAAPSAGLVEGRYDEEAAAAKRMFAAVADVLNADGSNHLAKIMAIAAVAAAELRAAVADAMASNDDVTDLFLGLLRQNMERDTKAPEGAALH